jgi:hypothetical protein
VSATPNLNVAADLAFMKLPSPDPYAEVPQEMKDSQTWVVWKYELDKNGKPTKPPSNARALDGPHASTTDPNTWVDFHKAVDVADVRSGNKLEGIGFVFKKEFQGADLDGVVQTVDGSLVISPFGLSVAKLVNSYVEYSPTQTGLHLIWKSPIPLPEGHKKGNHELGGEIYDKDSPRFFTVTGDKVPGISADSITKITDPNRIKLIHFLVLNITNSNFTKLWTGAWETATDAKGKIFPSQSEADLSLCGYLVRGGFNTAETLDAAFRRSGLMREEWNHKSKYTIAKALNGHESKASPTPSEYAPTFGTADHITPKKIVWLWSKRFAQKLNLIVGNPDLGKGLITYYIAACCTTGRDWFDAPNMMGPSEVLLLNGEEDWDDTVVPRLMAAGADRSKVYWLKMSATKDGKTKEKELQLDRDMATLETFLEEHPAIRLVVVDPVSNYLGNAKMIDEQKIREVLTPLKEIANRRHLAVICVMHLNKKVELDAIHRIGGAMAFVGVARMVWLVAPKPNEDGTESDELLMVKVKGNIVQRNLKGLAFTTKVHYVPIEGEEVTTPYVEWIGDVDQNANQVTGRPQKAAHRPSEQLPACMDWLRQYLGDGAKLLVEDIEPAGKALHGFSSKTIQRARAEAGIITFPSGKRKAADGKTRDQYSCRLNAHDEAQIAEEAQTQF